MDIHELLKKVWPEWEITEKIGEGSFGVVYKAKRKDLAGESWSAIKVTSIPRSESELDTLSSEGLSPEQTRTYLENIVRDYSDEIRLMESVKGHSNIVSIEDYSIYEHKDKTAWDILIRMELLTPLTKYSALNDMAEKDIVKLGTDLCRALSVCAARRIVHRDVKPENIFINEFGDFKLGDFGVARKLDHATMDFTRTGAMNYMAPEIANGAGFETGFDDAVKADIYSLGLVMYWLANRFRLPFLPKDKKILSLEDRRNAFSERIKGTELPRPCGEISDGLWQVIRKACAFDPGQRYASAREMREALEAARGGTSDIKTPGAGGKDGGKTGKNGGGGPGGKGGKNPHAKQLIAFAAAALLLAAGLIVWFSRPREAVLAIRYLDGASGKEVAQPTTLVLAEGSHSIGPGDPDLPAGYAAEDVSPRRVTVTGNRADPEEIVFLYRAATEDALNTTRGWRSNGDVTEIKPDVIEHITIAEGGCVQYCSFTPPESAVYSISILSDNGYAIDALLFDTGIGSAFSEGSSAAEGKKAVIREYLYAGTERFFYFRFQDETKTGTVRILAEKMSFQNAGKYGDNITWTLADTGLLTVFGHGDMDEAAGKKMPWYDVKNSVKEVEVKEGVTSIAAYAFADCAYLADAALPSSLTHLGQECFYGCGSLVSLVLPNGLISIGAGVFSHIDLLYIYIPASVTRIHPDAFAGCEAVIYGKSGSAAETFAKEKSMVFIPFEWELRIMWDAKEHVFFSNDSIAAPDLDFSAPSSAPSLIHSPPPSPAAGAPS